MCLEISQNLQESTCAKVSFLIKLPEACNFIIKETLTQAFPCEFCEISKNNFFYRTPLVAASVVRRNTKHTGIKKKKGNFANVCFWNTFHLLCLTATTFMKILRKVFKNNVTDEIQNTKKMKTRE